MALMFSGVDPLLYPIVVARRTVDRDDFAVIILVSDPKSYCQPAAVTLTEIISHVSFSRSYFSSIFSFARWMC